MSDTTTGDNVGNNNDSSTAIILPTPVPVLVPQESRVIVFTKFLSWLTATLLATAVIISLISVTSERNDLREQLEAQSTELACRSSAAIEVNKAVGQRDNSIAQALVFVAEGDNEGLQSLTPTLKLQTAAVTEALRAQELALEACDKR